MLPESNMVSSQWLKTNIEQPKLIVLFTQMDDPVTGKSDSKPVGYIPNSIFFDFENVFCDADSNLPHTMPSATNFTLGVQKLGIDNDSLIVIYDNKGIYSAPRVWWMFKSMGHHNVYVLNGGLPNWLNQKLPTVPQLVSPRKLGAFQAHYNSHCFISAENVIQQLSSISVVDARSAGRFNGTQPEPRKGLRSGHIPTSINLPFSVCIEDTELKPLEELKVIFSELGLTFDRSLVFSCGSGVTACILALAATEIGFKKVAVYDGSWSEWGARTDLAVEL
ncbi:sulfurtransferase [Paraglaciecola arctica]|uniref:Sulfurtransferase n=1 Tax=Paraglaciecola arctica BSs20135 TaxID=493475 RepID=K6Y0Z0_9ALTE|nr:sulfurtransferase [Paraglaciecola arctica]GAC17596.1 thiosulfate/3-mercaptopyruvate sulfurtransferase [Paraglaciecola arctica BSs20135]